MRSTRRRRPCRGSSPSAGAERFDRKEYGACPGPLSATQAVTHGLYLKPGRRSVHTLYAVHHGDRESIEVFEVNAKSTPPAVTWIGCVVVPDPVGINSVAALPDGGFVLTNFDPRQPPPPRRQGRRPLAEADGGRTERRGLGVAREERLGEGAGQRIGGRERHRSLARRQVDLRRAVGQAVVPASLTRQDAGRATGDPAGLPRGQHSLGTRRQDAARGGSRHHARPAWRAAPAAVRGRKRLSSSASIRRR